MQKQQTFAMETDWIRVASH